MSRHEPDTAAVDLRGQPAAPVTGWLYADAPVHRQSQRSTPAPAALAVLAGALVLALSAILF